jgi:hypothetical protein
LPGADVSGLTSLAGGGVVGVGSGAEAGGGGGASSFFLQPAKVKAQANTVMIENDMNSFFILASRYTKLSRYVLRICGFYIQPHTCVLLEPFIKATRQFSIGRSSAVRGGKIAKVESLQEMIAA